MENKMKSLLSVLGIVILLVVMSLSGYSMIVNIDIVPQDRSRNEVETLDVLNENDELISGINKENFNILFKSESDICITCNFESDKDIRFAWYIYFDSNRDFPIEKIDYSIDNTLEYHLPNVDEKYIIKCFVKDFNTNEKVSFWLDNLIIDKHS